MILIPKIVLFLAFVIIILVIAIHSIIMQNLREIDLSIRLRVKAELKNVRQITWLSSITVVMMVILCMMLLFSFKK